MRLFAALPVTGDAHEELASLLAELRTTDWPVRWVRVEGLHLTVKFFGAVAQETVPPLAAALTAAVRGTPALTMLPRETGAFPALAQARVVWAGYETGPALELLAHRVEQAAERLGFPVDGRPFRAHVTLGRVREGQSMPEVAVRRLEQHRLEHGFTADRCILYQSVTGPGGSTYTPVTTFPLGA